MYKGNVFLITAIFILVIIGGGVLYVAKERDKNPTYLPDISIPRPKTSNSTVPEGVDLKVTLPLPDTKVTSPITVTGIVPAGWMFEGVFPVVVLDSSEVIIAQGHAEETVRGSWMNGKPTEFEATLTFKTNSKNGSILLLKENPSGLPENDETFEVPVKF